MTGLFSKHSLTLLAVFTAMAVAAVAIIWDTYRNEARHRTDIQLEEIASLVRYKSSLIGLWLEERRANARSAANVPAVIKDLANLQAHKDANVHERILGFLENLLHYYDFTKVSLFDANQSLLASFGETHLHFDSEEFAEAVKKIQTSKDAELVDLHLHADGSVRFGFLVPIHNKERLLGSLFFGMDPRARLYPLLKEWPKHTSSIEIDLMRPQDGDIIYLSPMKHRPELLLAKRSVTQRPSILTNLHLGPDIEPYQGQSIDYRGKKVLVAGQPIPNTGWQLLAKVDEEEALKGLFGIALNAGLLASLTLLLAMGILHFFWQRQRLHEAEIKVELAKRLEVSEANYRSIFSNSKVPSLVIDPESGSILSANKAALNFYGYSLDEITRLNISDINMATPEEVRARMNTALINEKNYFSFRHRLANGQPRDVEVFSGPLTFNQAPKLFSVIIDVTERRRLEEKLQEMATTDALTGLPNRRYFLERLQEYLNLLARGASHDGSLMMLDLDHFKKVNDTWGHAAGDQVLQQLASIMLGQLRKVDVPGRICHSAAGRGTQGGHAKRRAPAAGHCRESKGCQWWHQHPPNRQHWHHRHPDDRPGYQDAAGTGRQGPLSGQKPGTQSQSHLLSPRSAKQALILCLGGPGFHSISSESYRKNLFVFMLEQKIFNPIYLIIWFKYPFADLIFNTMD